MRGSAVALAVAVLVAMASPARAQDAPAFFLGPLEVSPLLLLRDAGTDSNVFNSNANPQKDTVATFVPQLDMALSTGVMEASFQGIVEFNYFQRFESERSVNRRFATTIDFPLTIVQPGIAVSYARVRERATSEIDVRAPRTDFSYSANLARQLSPSSALRLNAGIQRIEYDRGVEFRDVELATQLNRRTINIGGQVRVAVTPLTQFLVDIQGSRDQFELAEDLGTDNLRATLALEFAPDAVLRGRASFGYHKMVPFGQASGFAFKGAVAAVDVNWVLLGRTRFDVQFARDANYSAASDEPYYVSLRYGLAIQHNLVGPVDVVVRGNHETLDYEAVSSRRLQARLDTVTTVGGGLAVRATPQFTVGLNYEDQKRLSTASDTFDFVRRRLYTTISYEF